MPSWWYVSNGARKGPVSDDELYRLFASGALTANSLLWKEGMRGWEPATKITDLNALMYSLPPELPANEMRAWQRVNWKFVFLSYIIITVVVSAVAFILGAAHYWVGVFVSGSIILILGLTVIGCMIPEDRWVNLTLIAFLFWLSNGALVVAGTLPLTRWALSIFWFAIFVGIAGAVSLLITTLIKWSNRFARGKNV